MMVMTDKRRDSWFLVMWKTIWRLWRGDSLDGRPDCTLLRGLLRCLSFWRVLLGMLLMLLISSKECRPPWTSPKALLRRLGVHSSVFMIGLTNHEIIGALF